MADRDGTERKVWVLPAELSDRIKAFQASQGITSEVEAARRLLDSALQLRDTVPTLLRKLVDKFAEEKDLRVLARDVLINHTLVLSVGFDEEGMYFHFKDEPVGKLTKGGDAFIGESDRDGEMHWTPYPPRVPRRPPTGGPRWDPPKGSDLDEEIPF